MSTKCKMVFSAAITVILLNSGYHIVNSYNTGTFFLTHFSSGFAVGLLIAFGIKEVLRRTGFTNK